MDHQKVEQLFYSALEWSEDQRVDFVQRKTGDDPEVRSEVVRLLACHEENIRSGFPLDSMGFQPDIDREAPKIEPPDICGTTIDRYKLLEKIGEGGMGEVYLAEQLIGVRRKVAFKIVKPGLNGRQVVSRFEVERQAMAMLEHNGIARVLDSGSTEDGRPFFVMELVRGQSITEYAAHHQLSGNDRVRLFRDVCWAVQHAHQKGIIHRDLKPPNIMVTHVDGVPQIKIIDFGIAKALEDRLTDATCFTRYATIIGTPQYMSPEQADARGTDVDTRTDIYALGVVLYELLTGNTPVSAERLSEMSPLQQLETIREAEDFTPPSTVNATPLIQREIGNGHRPQLTNVRDLDCVVLKALSRDRNLRYQTASEFAVDLQRYLDGEPVSAVPPSRFYKFKRWAARNRGLITALVLITTTLIASSVLCLMFAINAWQANSKKDQAFAKLRLANNTLRENNRKLQEAQASVRFSAIEKLKVSALEAALNEFEYAVWQQYSQQIPRFRAAPETDRPDVGEGFFVQVVPRNLVKLEQLCDFRNRELVRSHVVELEQLAKNIFSLKESVGRKPQGVLEYEVADLLKENLARLRVEFFEILVRQYRRVLGEQEPHVASALQMLACARMEVQQWSEAESAAREASAITTDPGVREMSVRTLARIRELRDDAESEGADERS